MGDLSLEKVSETYLDVLKEIGNIGAGNAMTALSQMLNCKVDMKVPQVKLLDFNEVGALMGGEEQVMVGVFLGCFFHRWQVREARFHLKSGRTFHPTGSRFRCTVRPCWRPSS